MSPLEEGHTCDDCIRSRGFQVGQLSTHVAAGDCRGPVIDLNGQIFGLTGEILAVYDIQTSRVQLPSQESLVRH